MLEFAIKKKIRIALGVGRNEVLRNKSNKTCVRTYVDNSKTLTEKKNKNQTMERHSMIMD